ncbi:MAG: hypothetical protein BIFFINMI_02845 [Phycisphaerae bacterium]|nr:hypothetical protein [Phycisphaerae bacterium]
MSFPDLPSHPHASPAPLSRRGRDLLAAVRRVADDDAADLAADAAPKPAEPIAVCYLAPADPDIDAEAAALALARRLEPESVGQAAAPGVALLMLDPLGATLRRITAAAPAPRRVSPQRRVASRDEWNGLLSPLLAADRPGLLLVLDTTGDQFRLTPDEGAAPTAVVLASAGSAGRVAAYRTIKQLDQAGAGEIGVYFAVPLAQTDDAESADAAPVDDFARLAAAAEEFLGRRLVNFGQADDAAPAFHAEMLGQRPRVGGQENRVELTAWLADHTRPLACRGPALASVPAAGTLDADELKLASVTGNATTDAESKEPSPQPSPWEGEGEEETPTAVVELTGEGRAIDPSPSSEGEGGPAAASAKAGPGSPRRSPAKPGEGVGARVTPLAAWPADAAGLADLIARCLGQIAPGATPLDFRPPADAAILLAHRDRQLLLVRAAGASAADQSEALLSLLEARAWADAHWPLLRNAYALAQFPPEPAATLTLACESPTPALRRLAAASIPVALVELIRLDLSAASPATPVGLLVRPIDG